MLGSVGLLHYKSKYLLSSYFYPFRIGKERFVVEPSNNARSGEATETVSYSRFHVILHFLGITFSLEPLIIKPAIGPLEL